MRVLVKFNKRIYAIENVGVDNKCLPVVEGMPPYDEESSPLVRESVLWFKTLAMDAVYIDCHQRSVFWSPLLQQAADQKSSLETSPNNKGFIPGTAKPLFRDSSVYDFDTSPKEMIMKCKEAFTRFSNKSLTAAEFQKNLARILHVYILPEVTFGKESIFGLLHAKSEIEKYLDQTEVDMKNCGLVVDNLKRCVHRMTRQLLNEGKMENENYIRSCKKVFLTAFLKVVTQEIDNLNTELSAAQNNVNWAREHNNGDFQELVCLKFKRDRLYADIDKHIMTREAIKNVIIRRELTKRKVKKGSTINDCVHNVFVEVLKKLEAENCMLRQLCQNKVSICAAREAVLGVIKEVTDLDLNSDHVTKFELNNFVDGFLEDRRNTNKPEEWLTLKEKVAKLLQDSYSVAYAYQENGCKEILSEIIHIQNGFHKNETERISFISSQNSHKGLPNVHLSLLDITMREKRNSKMRSHTLSEITRKTSYVLKTSDVLKTGDLFKTGDVTKTGDTAQNAAEIKDSGLLQLVNNDKQVKKLKNSVMKIRPGGFELSHNLNRLSRSRSTVFLRDFLCEACEEQTTTNMSSLLRFQPSLLDEILSYLNTDQDEITDSCVTDQDEMINSFDSGIWGEVPFKHEPHKNITRQQQKVSSSLMASLDDLKSLIQRHLTEMIHCLDQQFDQQDSWEISSQEYRELLWKSYEHFFCQELNLPLMQLYRQIFTANIRQTYYDLSSIPLQDLLQGDKLIDLFFGQNVAINRTAPIVIPSSSTEIIPGFDTSDQVFRKQFYHINNVDNELDINTHYHPELHDTKADKYKNKLLTEDFLISSTPSVDDGFGASSCSFSSSVLSDFSTSVPSGFSTSVRSELSVGSLEDTFDNINNWKLQSKQEYTEIKPESIEPPLKLHSVLTPFKEHIGNCLMSNCFLDKVRCITKAIEVLNRDISHLFGSKHQSTCDDIISMLVLALYHTSEEMFVDLYINLRLLMDVLPGFLTGSLWDFNLTSLCASYDYIFNFKVREQKVKWR